jgi:hypothetical protein
VKTASNFAFVAAVKPTPGLQIFAEDMRDAI